MKSPYGLSQSEANSIVSVLSGQTTVKITQGQNWSYSFEDNCIYYNESDLWYLTVDEFIGNILHEVGHALYSKRYSDLKVEITNKVKDDSHWSKLFELNNAIEDFRIEDRLRKEYPYGYDYLPEYGFKIQYLLSKKYESYTVNGEVVPKYIQYCWGMYVAIAGVLGSSKLDEDVIKTIDKTIEFGNLARRAKSHKELTEIICRDIYPHIKKYLDEYAEEEQKHDGCGGKVIISAGANGDDDADEAVKGARRMAVGASTESARNLTLVVPNYTEMFNEIKPLINQTATALERILINKKESAYVGKFRTGQRINSRRLYQFASKDNPRLFDRKYDQKEKKYIFNLVVDMSGSMAGGDYIYNDYPQMGESHKRLFEKKKMEIKRSKAYRAAKTAILFANVLDKVGIPYMVSGFNSKVFFYSNYGDRIDRKMQFSFEQIVHEAYNTGRAVGDCGTNNDADAVFLNRKKIEANNAEDYQGVMVVLSDGLPANSGYAIKQDLGKEVRDAQRGGIDVIGIGIQSSAVKNYYTNNIVIDNAEELPEKIVGVLKQKIKSI